MGIFPVMLLTHFCTSEVVYAMPKYAQNVDGKWCVIVNDVHYYSPRDLPRPSSLLLETLHPEVSVLPNLFLRPM